MSRLSKEERRKLRRYTNAKFLVNLPVSQLFNTVHEK
jgi:hypothetical protein